VNPRTEHQRSAGLQVLDVREADERQPGASAAPGASRCCSLPPGSPSSTGTDR